MGPYSGRAAEKRGRRCDTRGCWGDVDCLNGVTIGDAQKIARDLIDLAITQAEGCLRIGDSV